LEHLLEIQHARLSIHDGEIDDAKRRLHRRQLVELVEHNLRHRIALQLNDDAHTTAIRLITQIGNAVDLLLVDQLGDALEQTSLVNLERNLGDNDRIALLRGTSDPIDAGACAQLQYTATFFVRLPDLVATVDESAGWEIRTSNDLRQVLDCNLGIFQQRQRRFDDLGEVVWRNLRRHSDCDA